MAAYTEAPRLRMRRTTKWQAASSSQIRSTMERLLRRTVMRHIQVRLVILTNLQACLTFSPDGPARNPSSIQRGSVRFSSLYSGDPSTVGWASAPDSPRGNTSLYNPSIPSIPISMKDALPLLTTLQGHGVTAKEANRSGWKGGFGNITYDSGPAPGALVNMDHLMHESIEPVWDVIGVINGTNPDEVVVVGNHRDAWVIGGAADPNSGSAVLIEMANAFGKLLEKGWKPRRTMYVTGADSQR